MAACRRVLTTLALMVVMTIAAAGESGDERRMSLALPGETPLTRLVELVADFTQVNLQYQPQKIAGSVRIAIRGELTAQQLWDTANHVLWSNGYTTVVSTISTQPIYQVVPAGEAAAAARILLPEEMSRLTFQPGFAATILDVQHLSPEQALKLAGALQGGQTSQLLTLGDGGKRLLAKLSQSQLRELRNLLALMDRPGVVPATRLIRPERTAAATLQASAAAAWQAMQRVAGGSAKVGEVLVAPDGLQLLLIAATEDMAQLEQVVRDVDRSEPTTTQNYRPLHFSLDDVATLIGQLLKAQNGAAAPDIIKDRLTNSLVVTATVHQHERITALIRSLDETPTTSRRQMRIFPIKHRRADELARMLGSLLGASSTTSDDAMRSASGTGGTAPPTPTAPTAESPGNGGMPNANNAPAGNHAALDAQPATVASTTINADGMVLTTDGLTNRIIVMAEPLLLERIATLVRQIDVMQPQVDLDVTLVTLNHGQDRTLGVEMIGKIQRGSVSMVVGSLFGLSEATDDTLNRGLPANANGFGGLILNPGDYAGVIRAIENVTQGRSVIRSRVVVANNAKANISGVVQEPFTSLNSGQTVSTTSYGGTSDAGTQISIMPQISPADFLTLTYTINQSAFLGAPLVSENGVLPPTKRSDSISSLVTIPDGFCIALGGLTNTTNSQSEAKIPGLGDIPVAGALFRQDSTKTSDSRFYVFIRAAIMRDTQYRDLRQASEPSQREAQLAPDEPRPEPQMIK